MSTSSNKRQRSPEHMSSSIDPVRIFKRVYNSLLNTSKRFAKERRQNFQVFTGEELPVEATQLGAALAEVASPFAFCKTINSDSEQWGNLRDPTSWKEMLAEVGVDMLQQVEETVQKGHIPFEELLKLATPAPFGQGPETVLDTTVRNGLEIPAEKLKFLFESFLKAAKFEEWMMPEMRPIDKKWEAKPYKMHLYGPGGKFEMHRDTLHGPNHVATLVVVLPYEHEGGQLDISHNGNTVTLDSAAKSSSKEMPYQCCMFFTSCPHAVRNVTGGWRIVMQYDIFEHEGEENDLCPLLGFDEDETLNYFSPYSRREVLHPYSHLLKSPSQQEKILNAAKALAISRSEESDGIALVLRHRYSLGALKYDVLKGSDRWLYDMMAQSQEWDLQLQGLIFKTSMDCESGRCDIDAFPLYLEDFTKGNEDEDNSPSIDHGFSGTFDLVLERDGVKHGDMIFQQDYMEYTGNESQPLVEAYYFACLMMKKRAIPEDQDNRE